MSDLDTLRKYLEHRWGIRWTEEHARDVSQLMKKAPDDRLELPQTLETLVNGETYFFRYPIYLQIMQELMKSRVEKGVQARFRILCAGCSTGEEAYSVTFALSDAARKMGCKLEILGVDLRGKALETARAAIYFKWSLRNMGESERGRFLVAGDDGSWAVAEPYRSTVDFRVHNLMEPLEDKPFDTILLCNVLIYMHESAIRRVYEGLEGCVSPDTFLITGPADPPPGSAWYLQREYRGWPVYSRMAPAAAVVNKVAFIHAPSGGHPGEIAGKRHPKFVPGMQIASAAVPREMPKQSPEPESSSTMNDGLWQAWAQGKLESAADQIRQKVFFEPQQPLWRFLNGVILMEGGWLRKSMREIEKAGSLLDSYQPDHLISGLCTARELRRLIDFWRQQNG